MRTSLKEFEYLRVLEVTKAGWPHYHLVCRSPYVPQAEVSQAWAELTGAPIVDVRAIERVGNAYWYVVKYLSKQTYIPWTNRRVSWSRSFFPPRDRSRDVPLALREKQRYLTHPAEFANRELQGQTLVALTAGCWEIDSTTGTADPDEKAIRVSQTELAAKRRRDGH